jgi:Asp/Glu/hydantoin racemase
MERMFDRLLKIADMGVALAEVAQVYQNTERLLSLFCQTAQKTIRETGAEVIIVGTILSTLVNLQKIYLLDGVPIIDSVWAQALRWPRYSGGPEKKL